MTCSDSDRTASRERALRRPAWAARWLSLLMLIFMLASSCLNPAAGAGRATADAPPQYQGFVDSVYPTVSGWAWDAAAPASALSALVYIDGRLVAYLTANQYRPDVAAAHIGTGYYGFSWVVPTAYRDGGPHTVAVWAGVWLPSSGPSLTFQRPVSVLTWHNDLGRTGLNANETILTPASVSSGRFGRMFAHAVDGQVYAQPLYVPGLQTPGMDGPHNTVFVATEHDSVYAFDGDNPLAGPNHDGLLWKSSLIDKARLHMSDDPPHFTLRITPVPWGAVGSPDISPEIGITGTPVIDSRSGTLYVVAKTMESGLFWGSPFLGYVQRLHALDIHTGAEKSGSPVVINASVPGDGEGQVNGRLYFDARSQNQRAGLVLLNGVVYIAWASHGDNPCYHGWVMGYDAASLRQVAAWTDTPHGNWGGIWMAGAAPAAYGPYLFFETGNSDPGRTPYRNELGDAFVKLSTEPQFGGLYPVESFKPFNWMDLDRIDSDLGSGGAMLLPDSFFGIPHLLVGAGKEGRMYVINGERMGGLNSDHDEIVQSLPGAAGRGFNTPDTGRPQDNVVSSPAYYNGCIYYIGNSDALKAYQVGGLPYHDIDHSRGFASAHDLVYNGSAQPSGSAVRLTSGKQSQAGSVFTDHPVGVEGFETEFSFRLANPTADGFAFVLQNAGPHALGWGGGNLGYGGIGRSLAIKFGLYDDGGRGNGSTGWITGGASPATVSDKLVNVNLRATHYAFPFSWPNDTFHVRIRCDDGVLRLIITDLDTQKSDYRSYDITGLGGLSGIVGGPTAYAGFTGATGSLTAIQDILSWTYVAPDWYGQAPSSGGRSITPSISSDGGRNGLVWAIDTAAGGAAVLRAFEAQPSDPSRPRVLSELYASDHDPKDYAGPHVKFTVPTVANGKVYVGTDGGLAVFGLR